MPIMAKDSGGGDFVLVPAGNHNAVCVDVIDLGLQKIPAGLFGPESLKHQVKLVFELDEDMEDGRRFSVGRPFTLSLHENAALRAVLESWRSKAFTADELAGFDLEKVLGAPAMVQVLHKPGEGKNTGKTYANVVAVTPLPKGMARIQKRDYTRSERDSKMAAEGAAVLAAEQGAPPAAQADYDDTIIPF